MKIKVAFSLLIGMLFFINGFYQLWGFFFPTENLEVLRGHGYSGFDVEILRIVSDWLYLISPLGFVGLVLAGAIGYQTCKKLKISVHNTTVAFILAYIINKPISEPFRFFGYRNHLFANLSMHMLFFSNFLLAVLCGLIFLILPLYFKYFKYANPGGTA